MVVAFCPSYDDAVGYRKRVTFDKVMFTGDKSVLVVGARVCLQVKEDYDGVNTLPVNDISFK